MGERATEYALRLAAWALVLAGSLLNLLNFNDYPLVSPEVGLVLLAIAPVAAIAAVLHTAAPRLSFVFTGILVGLAVDLNSDGEIVAVAAGLAAAALAFRWDQVVLKLAIAGFSAVMLSQVATASISAGGPIGSAKAATTPDRLHSADQPRPIVHIVLDSYLGMEGMSADPAGFASLRRDNVDFWTGHGFRLYEGAYSRHANTVNSIPHMLSFGKRPFATTTQRLQHVSPGRLDYFDVLAARKYRVSAIMPDFIDLCFQQKIADCRHFRRSDLSSVAYFDLPTTDRARTVAITMAGMSRLSASAYITIWNAAIYLGLAEPGRMYEETKLFPLASAKALDEFEADLSSIQPGEVRFAHLLLPHDPYAFTADCKVRPKADWLSEGGPGGDIATRDARYRDQMRCLMSRIHGVLAELDSGPHGREAIVIVHGDHGSRIAGTRPSSDGEQSSRRDLAMTYSTLFAIRAPGIGPGVVAGRAPIEDLLGSFVHSGFATAPEVEKAPSRIILADRQWIPRKEAQLPRYSTALTRR